MRVSMTLREAEAIAAIHYPGASSPFSQPRRDHRPLHCDWWRSPLKVERFNSDRHRGALNLYFAFAQGSLVAVPEHSFPSTFDFSDGKRRNPDKGFVKMCLNAEPPILTCRMMQDNLIFDLTEAGRALLETS